jgi:hypothetical protein
MRRPDQVAVVACVLGLLLVAASAGGDAPGSVAAVADLMLGGAMVVLAGVLVALRNCLPRGRLRWSPGSASGARRSRCAPCMSGRVRTRPGRPGRGTPVCPSC